jgi:hypothetical protein
MPEQRIGGIKGRLVITVLYAILCVLEIRGYLFVRAGKSVLEIPFFWKVAFGAFGLWFCWEIFKQKYKKSGLFTALFASIWDWIWLYGAYKSLLGFAGYKILEPTPVWQMAIYAILIAFLGTVVYTAKLGSKILLQINDRIAALMLVVLLATKIGMRFVAGHDAILLKGAGCIAISIGMIEMFLGLLNAMSPEESEFPQFPADASAKQPSPAPKSRTMKGEVTPAKEQPLALRRLARLDQSPRKSWRTPSYPRRSLAGIGNHRNY